MRIVSADVAPRLTSDASAPRLTEAAVAPGVARPFEALVTGAVQQANELDATAGAKAAALAAGKSDDIHGTMIAAKEAEISVKLLGTIRNQLLEAFHEIWRTGV